MTEGTLDIAPIPRLMANTQVLSAQGLGKEYRVYDSPRARLLALLGSKAHFRSHWALKDVHLELNRGQCLGLVGDNGAGKSTLLKLLAKTLRPTSGTLRCQGRITAILELGAGFHPEFTGLDNLRFAGGLIGLEPDEITSLEPSILEFAELGEAIHRPVKTYSSGMVVRLAFALVTALQPDVLIIDEALAVGDQHFQKKCIERISQFRQGGCTIVFCSHSLYHIRHLCDTALWLDQGTVRALGDTESVMAAYESHVRAQDANAMKKKVSPPDQKSPLVGSLLDEHPLQADVMAKISSVKVEGLEPGTPPRLGKASLDIKVVATMRGQEQPSFGVMLEQAHGVGITSVATHADGVTPRRLDENGADAQWCVTLTFPDLPLHTGEYCVSVYLFDRNGLVIYDEWKDCVHFSWTYPSLTPGLVRLPHTWS